jgi:hypothetical protein
MDDVQISLSRNDLGQLLEGLDVLIEQWEATDIYLTSGLVPEDACIRESHSANESRAISDTYRNLRDRIREQYSPTRYQ